MLIEHVHLQNVRKHVDLRIDFTRQFTAIVGLNGSGKTTLLSAIAESLSALVTLLISTGEMAFANGSWAHLKHEKINGKVRFEAQYPVRVDVSGNMGALPLSWGVVQASQVPPYGTHDLSNPLTVDAIKSLGPSLPLFAYYRAERSWQASPINHVGAALAKESKADAFANWRLASADSAAFQQWATAKSLARLETATERHVRFADIRDDELAALDLAIAASVEGARGLRFDLASKMLLVEWSFDRSPTPYENLSDGQRSAISLVGDIARRACLLNPHLGQDVVASTPGVILIDELDLHLHPEWQRRIVRGLKEAFPAMQFIVASHSPQVLGELEPDEIVLLRGNETGHPHASYGLDSNSILEEVMGATSRTKEVAQRLKAVFEMLERNDLSGARRAIEELQSHAPELKELVGAQTLLARREIIGR